MLSFMPTDRTLFESFVISFFVFFDEPLDADVTPDIVSKLIALEKKQKARNPAISITERGNCALAVPGSPPTGSRPFCAPPEPAIRSQSTFADERE